MGDREFTDCRLCGADDADLLWVGHDLSFDLPGEFPLVRCRVCGLVYLHERPSPEAIGHFYPPDYLPYRKAIQDEPHAAMQWARRRNLQKRIEVVERSSPRTPGRILDVGASTGVFLDGMRSVGWETVGVEINPQAVQYAQDRLGLQVLEGFLHDQHLPPGSFDAITVWDVLEHTFDPLDTLCQANQLLVDGGVIVMTIPNWESLDRALFGKAWIGYDIPRHLYSFPRPVLTRLLESGGFQLVSAWCGLSSYFTFIASVRLWANAHLRPAWARRGLLGMLNIPGIRFVFQPLFSLLDYYGKSGTLVVVARKKRR